MNYTDGENRDSGDDLYNIMPLNAKLALTQRLGRWDNSIELVVVDGKDDVSDVRNEIPTSSYELAEPERQLLMVAAARRPSRSRTCSTSSTRCRSVAPIPARA